MGVRKPICPICRDPAPFALWQGDELPAGCPYDRSLRPGRDVMCEDRRRDAERAAHWRKIAPECFDDRGSILPGGLARVLSKLTDDTKDTRP